MARSDPLLRLLYRLAPSSLHRGAARLLSLYRASRICDVGGGAGHLARALLGEGHLPSLHVVVDPDPGLLSMAPRLPWVERVVGVAERLPLRGGSCSHAVFHDSLHHLDDPEQAIDEALRVARCILVDDFDASRRRGRLLRALERLAGYPARFYTLEQLEETLRRRGMRILHREPAHGPLASIRVLACLPEGLD